MFFCDQEGKQSSFQGVRDVIDARSLFCPLKPDIYLAIRNFGGNMRMARCVSENSYLIAGILSLHCILEASFYT